MKQERKSGLGIFDLLTVAFIVLKLTGVITWHWIWALSPFWIPIFIIAFVRTITELRTK